MFAKVWTFLVILLAISLEVHAHAAISPALGVAGEPKRRDAKRPTLIRPCGLGVNVAKNLDTSTPVQAAPDGTFTATITNFNAGRDGSRQVTARVDAAATGKNANFVDMTVSQNGDAAPKDNGSQQLVASLPAGTKCTGGASGDLCLVSFKTLGNFGNCIAVQQAGAGVAAGAAAAGAADATAADAGTGAGTATGTDTTGNAAVAGAASTTGAAASAAGKAGAGAGAAGKTGASTKTGGAGAGGKAGAGAGAGTTAGAGAAGKTGAGADAGAGAGAASKTGAGKSTAGKNSATQANQANSRVANTKGRVVQGGTRAARALLADFEERGEEFAESVRRGIANWIWA